MDEIRRRLALIDEQLSGRTLQTRLVSTAPLVFPAVGLTAGIAGQSVLAKHAGEAALPMLIWLSIALLAIGTTTTAGLASRHRQSPRPQILAWSTLLCFACLGAIRLIAFESPQKCDIRSMIGSEQVLATVRGRILTQPRRQSQDWCFAAFAFTDPSTAFYLELAAVNTRAGWRPTSGTIRVDVAEPTPKLEIGDSIQAYCWLHRFDGPSNPGQFDFAQYLKRRNIYVGATVPAHEAIRPWRNGPRGPLLSLRGKLAKMATQGLLGGGPPEEPEEPILEALLLGQRSHIDPDTYETFRKTGLLHLISLSGMHLGILIGLVWWASRSAGLMKRGRATVCILATIVFLLVVPPRAPALRAGVIVWAYCGSVLVRRRGNPLNSLSLAAIVLLLLRPTQLFEAGWQLSFAAVGGILAFTGGIEGTFLAGMRRWLDSSDPNRSPLLRIARATSRGAIRLLSAGLSAWLGSAGIVLYHFHTITPLASLWTTLAFLPVAAILTLGFLKILLFFALPTVSMLLGHILAGLTASLLAMVAILSRIDLSHLVIGHVPVVLVLGYYAILLFATFAHLRRPAVKQALCVTASLALVISLGVIKRQRTHRDHLQLTCLDVGHGQAILVQLPGTKNLLFDAGSLYGDDIGTRVILPFLDYIGVNRLHAIIVSHYDVDHLNGIPEVVDRRRVDHVFVEDAVVARTEGPETSQLLAQHLAKRGLTPEDVPRIIEDGPARISKLWPTEESAARPELTDNDRSLVSLIQFADTRVLLCSDVENDAQREILSLYPNLRADVVLVPHHGSKRTLEAGFLEQLEPSILIISCGRRDYQPGRIAGEGMETDLFVTARDGAVSVCIDKTGVVTTAILKTQQGE